MTEYHMGEEKIEQNIERVYSFVFQTLGCSYEDANKIFKGTLKKWKIKMKKIKMKNLE